jgi:hypothetical protein
MLVPFPKSPPSLSTPLDSTSSYIYFLPHQSGILPQHHQIWAMSKPLNFTTKIMVEVGIALPFFPLELLPPMVKEGRDQGGDGKGSAYLHGWQGPWLGRANEEPGLAGNQIWMGRRRGRGTCQALRLRAYKSPIRLRLSGLNRISHEPARRGREGDEREGNVGASSIINATWTWKCGTRCFLQSYTTSLQLMENLQHPRKEDEKFAHVY